MAEVITATADSTLKLSTCMGSPFHEKAPVVKLLMKDTPDLSSLGTLGVSVELGEISFVLKWNLISHILTLIHPQAFIDIITLDVHCALAV